MSQLQQREFELIMKLYPGARTGRAFHEPEARKGRAFHAAVAAFFAEPMQSGGGAILPPRGYWEAMQAVIRIDEVETVGPNKIVSGSGAGGNVMPFPASMPSGPKPDNN